MNLKRIKTKIEIHRCWGWANKPFIIPIGSTLKPATNIDGARFYWLVTIPPSLKNNEEFKSWKKIYGILIEPEELIHGNK